MSKRSVALYLSLAALLGNQASAAQRAPGSTLRDCATCPELVVMKADTFTMGSSPAQREWAVSHGATAKSVADEALPHVVSIKSFALGKYDVTRGEYAAFVRASGYVTPSGCKENGNPGAAERPGATWDHPGMNQSDRDPVICVSWDDANAYLAWLNTTVGAAPGNGPYRLPTESEWEYAARAGTTTPWWCGETKESIFARKAGNVLDESMRPFSGTVTPTSPETWNDGFPIDAPVGRFAANAFGLHDVIGNVWEWCADRVDSTSDAADAAVGDAAVAHVIRGGSFLFDASAARSSHFDQGAAGLQGASLGQRPARSLEQGE
jgi:formylglycine-generating enzyme required for sulfatase activity